MAEDGRPNIPATADNTKGKDFSARIGLVPKSLIPTPENTKPPISQLITEDYSTLKELWQKSK